MYYTALLRADIVRGRVYIRILVCRRGCHVNYVGLKAEVASPCRQWARHREGDPRRGLLGGGRTDDRGSRPRGGKKAKLERGDRAVKIVRAAAHINTLFVPYPG